MSQKSMTTQDIKRGLQNIKKAQLQVLKQLKADSYLSAQQSPNAKENTKYSYQSKNLQNFENQQSNMNKIQKPQEEANLSKNIQKRQLQQNKKVRSNEQYLKSSVNTTASNESIEKLKKQFSSQRQQLNQKFVQITRKLNSLERQTEQNKNQQKYAQKTIQQFNEKVSRLEQQNAKFRTNISTKNEQIQGLERVQKKLRSQLQLKGKQNTILETQIKSLRSENIKQSRTIKMLQAQLKQQSALIKQRKQEKQQPNRNDVQSRLNLDMVMKEVKIISNNHDFLFNRLKQSASTLEMSWVEKQSQIQTSFSRMLEYFETISTSNEVNNETYDIIGMANGFQNKNQQSRETIRKDFTGTQSRVEQQQELQYFVREMNKSNNARKQSMQDLLTQNQSLKKRVRQLTLDLATFQTSQPTNYNNNNRNLTESNRLIGLQLQQMRQQVMKLKRYKVQLKEQHQEQQKQIIKYKLKVRDLQNRLEIQGRKFVQANNVKFGFQKKCQQQDIQITSLNNIIKELNSKLYPSKQSPQSVSLNNLRQQFTKLLQANSLIQRQSESLKVINEGLQTQITNLKYEKSQFQTANKQKFQIVDRQIKEKDRLVEELQKKDQKLHDLFSEVDKFKSNFLKNQQQFLKQKKHYEDLLEQKSQQILQLRKQIEDLYKQSREYHQLMFKHEKLQAQFKQLSRKSLKMGETLTHLWSVKQAEYYNIHQILGSFRNKQKEQNESQEQVSGHF